MIKNLKRNLKQFRKSKGYSKLRLARETGLCARSIEYIEAGKAKNPRIETLKKIANVLDITVEDLIS